MMLIAPVMLFLSLTACQNNATYTITGTFTGTGFAINSPATVTVTQGSNSYSANAAVPAPDGLGNQTATYSISGIPAGTYSLTLTATDASNGCEGFSSTPTYSVNGGSSATVDGASNTYNGSSYSMTVTINGAAVSGSETVTLTLGSPTPC